MFVFISMFVTINDNVFRVKPAITPESISEGMKNKTFDNNNEGMYFLLEEKEHCFWMKDCIIELDMIFIKDGIVTKIYENCPPCKNGPCETYCAVSDRVLEIGGGLCKEMGIKEGDSVNVQLF